MEIRAPEFPESIAEGELTQWYKQEGEYVLRDEVVADIETEKTTVEIVAPADGLLTNFVKQEGDVIESENVICHLDETAERPATADAGEETSVDERGSVDFSASPAARKLAIENEVDLSTVNGTGRAGTITKQDVSRALEIKANELQPKPPAVDQPDEDLTPLSPGERTERRVPMTRLRAFLAQRLVEVQQTTASLSTFNEANMEPIKRMRAEYQQEFMERHNGTRLGYMSFFVRSSVEALKRFPAVNASIDGEDVIYHGYYDIGVAVSTDRGLVVPIIRDADALGLHQIEDQISDYGTRARENKLGLEEMQGGTFTISNGGVFGSLLSTPILNPPQTAILGMHAIQDRPVAIDGEVVVRPMMYLALSYDHRMIDGSEAVRFLATIKGMLEDPARILLEL